jgi:TolB protein
MAKKTPISVDQLWQLERLGTPSLSPDGAQAVVAATRHSMEDNSSQSSLWLLSTLGGAPRRLTSGGDKDGAPRWSPRGDLIAFTARDERNAFDLFTVNVETGKLVRLTQDASNNEEPAFSPSGRLILFTSTRTGSRHLHVMTFDGNNQVPLPVERADYATPDWGP